MSSVAQSEPGRRECRFCHGRRLRSVYRQPPWVVARCLDCCHFSTVPWPTDDDLEFAYGTEYFQAYGMWSSDPAEQQRLLTAYSERVRRVEDFVKPPGRLIEIGSGTGLLVVAALQRGWDAVGYDPSEAAVQAGGARLRDRLRVGFIEDASRDEATADVFVAYHVLEHTPDPRRFLQLARLMLRPGGFLVIEVPHVRAFDTRWLPSVRRLVLDVPRHLCHFTPRTLVGLVEETGFRVRHVDGSSTAVFHGLRRRLARVTSGETPAAATSSREYRDDVLRRVARRWLSGYAFCLYAHRPDNDT